VVAAATARRMVLRGRQPAAGGVAAQKSIMGLGNVVVAVIGVVGGNLPCLVKKVREGDDDWVDCRMFKVG